MAMASSALLRSHVTSTGFHSFDVPTRAPLEALARRLGHPVASAPGRPPVDTLVPKPQEDSRPRTLSSIHGTHEFPLHTETAHWREPADLVLFRCVNPGAGNRPTRLVDGWNLGLKNAAVAGLKESLMVVRNGSKSFLAPLVTQGTDGIALRYDPGCMVPCSEYDKGLLATLERSLLDSIHTSIQWEAGRCVILDNHRMLHSRANTSIPDPDRRLERVYIVSEKS